MEVISGAIVLIIGMLFGYLVKSSIDKTHCDTGKLPGKPHDYGMIYSRIIYVNSDLKKAYEEIWLCKNCGHVKRILRDV